MVTPCGDLLLLKQRHAQPRCKLTNLIRRKELLIIEGAEREIGQQSSKDGMCRHDNDFCARLLQPNKDYMTVPGN